MTVVVSLQDIVEAMDLPSSEWEAYLDPATGEIVVLTDEDQSIMDAEDLDPEDLPAWQREAAALARALLETNRALRLPDSFDINEWELMLRFANSLDDAAHSRELLDAIHGTGAFRMFRSTIARLRIREQWYSFRQEALENIAREWLTEHGIAFVEGARPEALSP